MHTPVLYIHAPGAVQPVCIIRISAPDGDVQVLVPAQERSDFSHKFRCAVQHSGYTNLCATLLFTNRYFQNIL